MAATPTEVFVSWRGNFGEGSSRTTSRSDERRGGRPATGVADVAGVSDGRGAHPYTDLTRDYRPPDDHSAAGELPEDTLSRHLNEQEISPGRGQQDTDTREDEFVQGLTPPHGRTEQTRTPPPQPQQTPQREWRMRDAMRREVSMRLPPHQAIPEDAIRREVSIRLPPHLHHGASPACVLWSQATPEQQRWAIDLERRNRSGGPASYGACQPALGAA